MVGATTVTARRLVEEAVERGFSLPCALTDETGPTWDFARALADALAGVRLNHEQVRHLAWQIGCWGGTTLAGIITTARTQPPEGTHP